MCCVLKVCWWCGGGCGGLQRYKRGCGTPIEGCGGVGRVILKGTRLGIDLQALH